VTDDQKPRAFATLVEAMQAIRQHEESKRRTAYSQIANAKKRTVIVIRHSPQQRRGRGR
jgi:hypothetical protein